MEDVAPRPRRSLPWAWRWIPVAGYCGLIVGASSIPAGAMPASRLWSFDKIIHAGVYAVLGALLVRALCTGPRPPRQLVAAAMAVAGTVIFGAMDELYQSTTPGRHPSVFDAIADGVGGAIGVVLASFRYGRRQDGNHPQVR